MAAHTTRERRTQTRGDRHLGTPGHRNNAPAASGSDPKIIHVAGSAFSVELGQLRTKDLKLDPSNPRIRYLAETKGVTPKNNKEICDLLFKDEDIQRLRQDIKRDRGLHEEILVNADGSIIEGNSRAACYLTLLAVDPGSGLWDSIPAKILKTQMKPADVAMLQGYYHVRMKNKWATFAKAEHVYRLQNEHGMSIDAIRQSTGMHKKTIEDMIRTYQTMRKHSFDKKNTGEADNVVRTYSHFHEFEKSPDEDVVKLRESNGGRKKFADWVRAGMFERGEDVRLLGPILRDRTALKAFQAGGAKQAKRIVRRSDPTTDLRQYRAVRKLTEQLNKRFMKEVELVRENPGCRTLLQKLRDIINRMLTAAAAKA